MLSHKNLTTHCSNVIYTSFIRPVLDYCNTVWNCCGKGNTSSLERLQRRAARIICKLNYNRDKAVASLRWSTLQCRREDHVFNLAKKCIAGRFLQVFRNYFTFHRSICSCTTRQSNYLYLPRVRTKAVKRFYYSGCVIFIRLLT